MSRSIDAVNRPARSAVQQLDAWIGWIPSAVSMPLELILSLPYLGRVLSLIWKSALAMGWAVLHLPYGLLALIGIQPEMRLRIHLLVATGNGNMPEGAEKRVGKALQVAARILKQEANVRLVLLNGPESDEVGWPVTKPLGLAWERKGAEPGVVACNMAALWEDLSPVGGRFDRAALRGDPWGSYRRIIGWGAPLATFFVDEVEPGLAGCSLGPLTDYVTVLADKPVCLAHELAHACNLWHRAADLNLMNSTCGGVHLERWQVALLRMSRHVTAW
ncbi:MAG: hypothetical protein R3191_02465 [Anaerolineales bacterium]|nr:hypothetical protein [Anaerolineales bacterium]